MLIEFALRPDRILKSYRIRTYVRERDACPFDFIQHIFSAVLREKAISHIDVILHWENGTNASTFFKNFIRKNVVYFDIYVICAKKLFSYVLNLLIKVQIRQHWSTKTNFL